MRTKHVCAASASEQHAALTTKEVCQVQLSRDKPGIYVTAWSIRDCVVQNSKHVLTVHSASVTGMLQPVMEPDSSGNGLSGSKMPMTIM